MDDFRYRVTVAEVANAVPGAVVVNVPNDWFLNLPKNERYICRAFYAYIAERSKLEYASDGLGVYVGSILEKKLYESLKKIIAKISKLSGVDLDSATNRAYFFSGPLRAIKIDTEIVGPNAVVLPEMEQGDIVSDALWELRMKKVRARNRKIARSAPCNTFIEWLLYQQEREDRVGDLARDAVGDEQFPLFTKSCDELVSYLDDIGSCDDAMESAREAFFEYYKLYPNGSDKSNIYKPTVYFIQTDRDDCVKIGYTSSLASRLRAYATHSSVEPRLLFSFPGDKGTERVLHKQFEHLRIEGKREWFRLDDEILSYIEVLRHDH